MTELLVVGAGRLGTGIAERWTGPVTAETQTPARHEIFRQRGWTARLRSETGQFENAVMSVPPSSTPDYPAEARRAVGLWTGRGQFVFVSSTAVYAEENGGEVTETSLTASTDRAARLLAAEAVVLAAGGNVVRLAGLYDEVSGPHLAYAKKQTSPLRGDAWINLLHRDDAADLVVAVLKSLFRAQIFLGAEDRPVRRSSLNKHCEFTGTEGSLGKKINSVWTGTQLAWQPRRRH